MSTESPTGYEEIDLRPYIQALLQQWWVILGAGLIAGIVAFVVMLFTPPTYESSALILVTKPRFSLQFDPRIETSDPAFAYLAYPTLALSDAVVDELLASLTISDEMTAANLRGMLATKNGSDPSLIVLTVSHADPVVAAEIANVWSQLFISHANRVFGQQGDESVLFLQEQLTRTRSELDRLDAALVALQAENPQQILTSQLNNHLRVQTTYLTQQRQTADLRRDVTGYALKLGMRPPQGVLGTADSTVLILLQTRAFGSESNASFLLDVSGGMVGTGELSVTEGLEILEDLEHVLQIREGSLAEELVALEPKILATQEALQLATGVQRRLQSEYDLAFSTYTTLARALDEALITSEDAAGQVRLASYGGVAEEPVGPRKVFNSAVAMILGGIMGIFLIFFKQWWQNAQNL